MNSGVLSFVREYCRLMAGRIFALAIFFILLQYPFYAGLFDGRPPIPREILIVYFLSFILLTVLSSLIFPFAHGSAHFPHRMYTLPLTTRFLVAWQLLLPSSAGAAVYLTVQSVLNLRFGYAMPILGPALFLAVFITCFQTALWATEAIPIARPFAIGAIAVPLLAWFSSQFGTVRLFIPNVLWESITSKDLLLLVSCCCFAYLVAVYGIARNRRGDKLSFSLAEEMFATIKLRLPFTRGQKRGASPAASQLFLEHHGHEFVFSAAMVCVILLAYCVAFFSEASEQEIFLVLTKVTFRCSLITSFFVGLTIARDHPLGGSLRMDAYRASRPLSDRLFARIILMAGAKMVLSVFAIGIIAHLIAWCSFLALGEATINTDFLTLCREYAGRSNSYSLFVMCLKLCIISWILMSLTCSLLLTGRKRFVVAVTGILSVGVIVAFALLIMLRQVLSRSDIHAVFYAISSLLLAALAASLFVAWRRGHLNSASINYHISSWMLLLLALCLIRRFWVGAIEVFHIALLAGVAALCLLPLALAPCAVEWNRHR